MKSPRGSQKEEINSEFKNSVSKVGWLMVKQQASDKSAASVDLNCPAFVHIISLYISFFDH